MIKVVVGAIDPDPLGTVQVVTHGVEKTYLKWAKDGVEREAVYRFGAVYFYDKNLLP